jgi:DNA-binding response OmpR family regulator
MFEGKGTAISSGQAMEQANILVVGRTCSLAREFKQWVIDYGRLHSPIEATCYRHLTPADQPLAAYRAILVNIDCPEAVQESLDVVETLRAHHPKAIVSVLITGRGTYNKIKYYLAGADHCIKFAAANEEPEVLALLQGNTEDAPGPSLVLDPTRMCLHGPESRLEISFVEVKILEALAQTKNGILSHDEIATVMGMNVSFYDPRALEKSISRLRGKIKGMSGANAIQSVRGYGYRLSRGLITAI